MLTEVVQVELVGKPWWEDLLALAALFLSLTSIWYTWWSRHTDKANLAVSATSVLTQRGHQESNIGVKAINTGLSGSAVAEGVLFRISRGQYIDAQNDLFSTLDLPATLAPHASADFIVSSKKLASRLVAVGRKPRHVRPIVRTGWKRYPGRLDEAGMKVLTDAYNEAKAEADRADPKTDWWTRFWKQS